MPAKNRHGSAAVRAARVLKQAVEMEATMLPAHRSSKPAESLLARIRGEYGEMPGLSLTAPQASRLWAIDTDTTARVLAGLVEGRFLRRTAVGKYVRASGDPTAHV